MTTISKLLEKASTPDVLNGVWKRFKNDTAVWGWGISQEEMRKNLTFYLLQLAQDLRSGVYMPDPVKFFPVHQGNGKQRIIAASTLRDKMAQRAILTAIEPLAEKKFFHSDSFAYRPGRNIDMALSRVREYIFCGMPWIVDADIEQFFDTIPHRPLIRILNRLINDSAVIELIMRWIDAGTIRRGFFSSPRGIPQGSILSPFLCNIYLTNWDNEMAAKNLPFVRYADDILVFTKSKQEAYKAHEYMEKSLKKMGLKLNQNKTRVAISSPDITFLGKKLPFSRMVTKKH